MKLAFAAEVRELDRRSIEAIGVPGVALMENAGRGTAYAMHQRIAAGSRIAIFCGAGNNGGDGYVMARHLLELGHTPEVFLMGSIERIGGDAAINLRILEKMNLPIHQLHKGALPDDRFAPFLDHIGPFDAWVDALLGTGLNSPVRGRYAGVIAYLKRVEGLVCSVDLPSGLNADTGQLHGSAVHADLTVTYGLSKPGLHLEPGRGLCGELITFPIGFPVHVLQEANLRGTLLNGDWASGRFTPRAANTHKGTYGHVFVVGGNTGKTGAAILSGTGAISSGAGLVTVGTSDVGVAQIAQVAWELMAEPWIGASKEVLRQQLSRASVVALGPGLGQEPTTRALLRLVLEEARVPLVLDADALNIVAADLSLLELAQAPVIITPHPGEMARLTGQSSAEVVRESLAIARDFAQKHGVIVVLKTATTVVASPDGRYAINSSGTPGMASAGMGDVLTGVIASLVAQGEAPWDAACLGVWVHGRAGERAARVTGERGLTARALLAALPEELAAGEREAREG